MCGRNAQLDFQLRQVQVLVCVLYTIDREIFTVKIIRGLNFRVKNICRSWFRDVARIRILNFLCISFSLLPLTDRNILTAKIFRSTVLHVVLSYFAQLS